MSLLKSRCVYLRNFILSKTDVLLGIHRIKSNIDYSIFNLLLFIAKKMMYKQKINNQLPNIQTFKCQLLLYYRAEKKIARENMEWEKFDLSWSDYRFLIE